MKRMRSLLVILAIVASFAHGGEINHKRRILMEKMRKGELYKHPKVWCEEDGIWERTRAGTTFRAECPAGHKGLQIRLCTMKGKWADKVVSRCSKTDSCAAEGRWPETHVGTVQQLTCDPPLSGIQIRRCKQNGKWSKAKGHCRKPSNHKAPIKGHKKKE